MKFAMGFKVEEVLRFKSDEVEYFNLFSAIKKSKGESEVLKLLASEFLSNFDPLDDIYVSATALMHHHMISAGGLKLLSCEDVDMIKHILCDMHFMTTEYKKIEWIREAIDTVDFSKKGLYVRYGMIEIRLLDSLLRDPNQVNTTLEKIHKRQSDSDYMYENMVQDRSRWLSSGDLGFNIKSLMTNAGFYLNESIQQAALDLNAWKDSYIRGILNGVLLSVPPAYPWYFSFWRRIQEFVSGAYIPTYMHFPAPEHFFAMLRGKKVLILTPFKEQIERMINEDRLRNLYKKFEITDMDLTIINAPISTYPNRPGSGWLDSFEHIKKEIDRQFLNKKFDFFTASCGCYGIPVAEYVYSKYDCTSLYYGNWLNTLFGIRQKCSLDFDAEVNDFLRIDSDLSKYKNMEKIDDGRYI